MDYSIKGVSIISEDSVIYAKGLKEINSLINNIKGLRLLLSLILIGLSSWIFLVTDSIDRKILVLCWITGGSGGSKALTVVGYTAIGCSN
jgi:hypothetical protein